MWRHRIGQGVPDLAETPTYCVLVHIVLGGRVATKCANNNQHN